MSRKRGHPLRASLRDRNAGQHLRRTTVYGNWQGKYRRPAGAPRSSTGRDADRKNPLVRTSWNLKNFPEGCCLKRDDLEEAIQNIIANEFSFMDMQNPGYLINVN